MKDAPDEVFGSQPLFFEYAPQESIGVQFLTSGCQYWNLGWHDATHLSLFIKDHLFSLVVFITRLVDQFPQIKIRLFFAGIPHEFFQIL